VDPPTLLVSVGRVVDLGVRPRSNQRLDDLRMHQEFRNSGWSGWGGHVLPGSFPPPREMEAVPRTTPLAFSFYRLEQNRAPAGSYLQAREDVAASQLHRLVQAGGGGAGEGSRGPAWACAYFAARSGFGAPPTFPLAGGAASSGQSWKLMATRLEMPDSCMVMPYSTSVAAIVRFEC